MKRPITRLFAALALTMGLSASAQVNIQPCVTYQAMDQVFKLDPGAKKNYDAVQAILNEQMETMPAGKSAAFEYTIPVVVHVLHMGGPENITDAEIQQALDWVNMDFESSHSDKSTVAQPFQGMMMDADIKLMLAHKDPQGNGTNGIIRHYNSNTVWDRNVMGNLGPNSPLYTDITWPAIKYLNIIVVKEIVAQPGQQGVVVGYTFKPGTFGANDIRDAVIMTAAYMKNFVDVRSLTHEVGHWLNLSHTFGDTNNPGTQCGDDNVCDTPPHMGDVNMGCQSSSSGNFCATTATCGWSAQQQNTENIMNYATCSKNFTAGQVARMRAALASNVSGRANLWTPTNILATGVDMTGPYAPRADFASANNAYTTCAGSSISFKEYAYGGTVDNYQWSAGGAGGIISNETSTMSTILFPVSGTVDVNLTVSNNLGSHVMTKIVTVVEANAQLTGPVRESFELGVLPQDWKIENGNTGSTTWKSTFSAGYDGTASFMIEGALMGANQQDVLYTPMIDMANSPVKEITFAYAYARKTAGSNGVFSVQASPDCGGSWVTLFIKSANQLSNGSGGIMSAPFTPTDQSQWIPVALSSQIGWSGVKDSPHLLLRFSFKEGSVVGNNLFIDAVTLPIPDALQELRNSVGLSLFPNPTDDKVNLQFTVSQASPVQIAVTDLAGRKVISVADGQFTPGQHTLEINSDNVLAKGIYLVNINVNGVKLTEKLVVR